MKGQQQQRGEQEQQQRQQQHQHQQKQTVPAKIWNQSHPEPMSLLFKALVQKCIFSPRKGVYPTGSVAGACTVPPLT